MSLQTIRDKSQGWVAWTIVIAICITFALWGVHSYLYGNKLNTVIAKVNGTKITKEALDKTYTQLKRQQQLRGITQKKSNTELKNDVLKSIITLTILKQAVNKNGFDAGADLLELTIANMPIFQINGVFSKERFTQITNKMSISLNDFASELKNNILINQMRSGIVDTSYATPDEIEKLIKLIKQKRKFSYIIIPKNRFLNKVKISDNSVKDYYKNNLDDFKIPEKVSIKYLQLSANDLTQKIHPTTQELKTFYQNNISKYTQPKKWQITGISLEVPTNSNKKQIKKAEEKIASIKKEIKNGKDIKLLTKEENNVKIQEDKVWISATELNPTLKNVLTNLSIGEISTPIKTQRGYEIIKLINIKPEKISPFISVKDKVSKMYKLKIAEQKFSELNDKLINITYENPNSLDLASKQLGLPIQKTDLFTRDSNTQNPKIVAAAFSDEVLNQNNNSEPINLKDNTVIVLRIDKHMPESTKPLKSVKFEIINKLKLEESINQAQKMGEQILSKLNAKQNISALLQQNKLQQKTTDYVYRYDENIDPIISDTAFRLNHAKNNAIQKLSSSDFAIISLIKIKEDSENTLTEKQYQIFKKEIENSFGLLEYQTYIEGLMNKAKIVEKQVNF